MPDPRPERGLIDASLVIGLEPIEPEALPEQLAIAAITLAGPDATSAGARERPRR